MTTREDIVASARARLGTPWVHQGRSEHGIDCVGLLALTARDVGLSTFDLTNYSRMPIGAELMRILRGVMPEIHPRYAYGLGDVIVIHAGGVPTHVGIVGDYAWGGQSLIHADMLARPVGRVVEHRLDDLLWKPRIVASFSMLDMKGYSK